MGQLAIVNGQWAIRAGKSVNAGVLAVKMEEINRLALQ